MNLSSIVLSVATAAAFLGLASSGPAAAQEIPAHCLKSVPRKPCVVPESVVQQLTPEQRTQAIEFARQNGIRWRIAKGK